MEGQNCLQVPCNYDMWILTLCEWLGHYNDNNEYNDHVIHIKKITRSYINGNKFILIHPGSFRGFILY